MGRDEPYNRNSDPLRNTEETLCPSLYFSLMSLPKEDLSNDWNRGTRSSASFLRDKVTGAWILCLMPGGKSQFRRKHWKPILFFVLSHIS